MKITNHFFIAFIVCFLLLFDCEFYDHKKTVSRDVSNASFAKKGKSYALLVSVENTDVKGFDSSVTKDGNKYRDNIEGLLKTFKIRNIKKLSSPNDKEFIFSFKRTLDKLNNEDLCVIYFYGHGGQVPDNGTDEADKHDETLVLSNRQFIDDEIYEILNSYKKTSRLIFIFEACNTGTGIKLHGEDEHEPPVHKPLVDKRETPTFDIIYIGATADGNSVPTNAFNKNFIKIIEDKEPKTYLELHKELSKKMFRCYKILPTLDTSYASEAFINSEPFKTN